MTRRDFLQLGGLGVFGLGLAEYRGGVMFELGCHILDLVIGMRSHRIQPAFVPSRDCWDMSRAIVSRRASKT